ncbi:MAG: hypothetical protein JXR97_00055, partial [Planctomycetes bacterium]|nr:hypothetical protein [Planctomycetota bacterium]
MERKKDSMASGAIVRPSTSSGRTGLFAKQIGHFTAFRMTYAEHERCHPEQSEGSVSDRALPRQGKEEILHCV